MNPKQPFEAGLYGFFGVVTGCCILPPALLIVALMLLKLLFLIGHLATGR